MVGLHLALPGLGASGWRAACSTWACRDGPLLEPNLNAAGLPCLSVGILGLLLAETVSLPVDDGAARNPADPAGREDGDRCRDSRTAEDVRGQAGHRAMAAPLAEAANRPQVIVSRVLAILAHSRPGRRVLPHRMEALRAADRRAGDGGVLPALALHADGPGRQRPVDPGGPDHPGGLLALAARGRRGLDRPGGGLDARLPGPDRALGRVLPGTRACIRFVIVACSVAVVCAVLGVSIPELAAGPGARAPKPRRGRPAALVRAQPTGSFWAGIDTSFRLPVLIAYLALVIVTMLWPARKNLAELIALSAALLVASQFWYLDKGGTLVLLYLPLAILMMFRPTMAARRPVATPLQPATTRV